jgi:hypothetical protein
MNFSGVKLMKTFVTTKINYYGLDWFKTLDGMDADCNAPVLYFGS